MPPFHSEPPIQVLNDTMINHIKRNPDGPGWVYQKYPDTIKDH